MAAPTRIFCILAKLQTGPGVDAVPTAAANAVRTLNMPAMKVKYLDDGSRKDEHHAGLGNLGTVGRFGRYAEIPIQLAVKGAGADYFTATNRPEADPFLQAAGLTVTESGGAGAGKLVYTTADASDTFPLLTVYAYTQYKLYRIIDAVVLPKITLTAGKPGVFEFSVVGRIATDPIDSTLPSGIAYNATVQPVFAGSQNSIGAFTQASAAPLLTRQATIDFGTTQVAMTGGGATDGLAGFLITDREVKHSATIQTVPLSALAIHALARQATQGSAIADTTATYVLGQAGGFNRVTIRTGQWGFEPSDGDASGLGTTVLDGVIAARSIPSGDGAGRELALTFD